MFDSAKAIYKGKSSKKDLITVLIDKEYSVKNATTGTTSYNLRLPRSVYLSVFGHWLPSVTGCVLTLPLVTCFLLSLSSFSSSLSLVTAFFCQWRPCDTCLLSLAGFGHWLPLVTDGLLFLAVVSFVNLLLSVSNLFWSLPVFSH